MVHSDPTKEPMRFSLYIVCFVFALGANSSFAQLVSDDFIADLDLSGFDSPAVALVPAGGGNITLLNTRDPVMSVTGVAFTAEEPILTAGIDSSPFSFFIARNPDLVVFAFDGSSTSVDGRLDLDIFAETSDFNVSMNIGFRPVDVPVVVAAIPEPSSFAMLTPAGFGLLMMGRHHRFVIQHKDGHERRFPIC